jgi:hypothetical protein
MTNDTSNTRPNMYEELLRNAKQERVRRQERRRLEQAKYENATALPKFTPDIDKPPPMEVRDYLREKIKSLLND